MQLSNLLKTVHPVRFYGIRAKSGEPNAEIRNAEHHDPDIASISLSPDPEIGSIHYRAQDVEPGGLFVAIKGLVADGHDFIDEALARGASAIVTQKPVNRKSIIIEVENTRRALAAISGRFYSNPSEKLLFNRYHRYQRQNNDCIFNRADSFTGRYQCGCHRNLKLPILGEDLSKSDNNARIIGSSENTGTNARGRDYPCCHGGLFTCTGSGPGLSTANSIWRSLPI